MQRTLVIALCSVLNVTLASAAVERAHFDPGVYGEPDGALLMEPHGNYVEPYFATKALLAAQDAGGDVHNAALAWINWVLPRQLPDGRIGRFCRKPGGAWRSCGEADADDSMLSLWMQLLYREAPDAGLPEAWQDSMTKAWHHLKSLRNARLGIFHVSRRNHVGLFMDNVEVYCALKEIARNEQRFGQTEQASRTEAEAAKLESALLHIFWDKRGRGFRVSTQKRQQYAFYPDAVAQTFAIPCEVSSTRNAADTWQEWKARFGASWLERRHDPHAWGLIALAAVRAGDSQSAICWVSRAAPLRYGSTWNILEEAIFQTLQYRFRNGQSATACAQVLTK